MTREHVLSYLNIWTDFGLIKVDLIYTELHLVAYLYLKTLVLYLPTMDLNKGDEEDSETEEKAMISKKPIVTVTSVRRIMNVSGRMQPATISLLAYDGKYFLGIKVALYDPATVSETGFFLTVK